MREWDEITSDLLRRRDEKIAQKKKQMRYIKNTAVSTLCLCIVAAAGSFIYKNCPDNDKLQNYFDNPDIITDETSSNNSNNVLTTTTGTESRKGIYHTTTTAALTPQVSTSYITSVFTSSTAITDSNTTLLTSDEESAVSAQQGTLSNNTVVTSVSAVNDNKNVIHTTATERKNESVTTTVTTTTTEPFINERSFIMKRYFAALAAASTLVTTTPVYTSPIVYSPVDGSYDYSAYFQALDSGNIEKDINGDGNFDIRDIFILYEGGINEDNQMNDYLTPEEEIRLQEVGDIDNDGEVSYSDYCILASYYDHTKCIVISDYDINNYRDRAGNLPHESWDFIQDFKLMQTDAEMLYNFTEKYNNETNFDLDFNCDGITDITDIYLYFFFDYNMERQNLYEKCDPTYKMIDGYNEDEYSYYSEDSFFADEAFEKCMNYYTSHYYSYYSGGFLLKYFMKNNTFSEEWLDVNNYINYLTEYTDTLYNTDDFAIRIIKNSSERDGYEFSGTARTICVELGYVEYKKGDNYCADLPSGNVANDYPAYAAAIANGTKAAPDVNCDGKLDAEDIDDIMDFIHYNNYPSELFDNLVPKGFSKLTPDIFDYLSTDFDINNNGLSCDYIDAKVACIYILNNSENSIDEIIAETKDSSVSELISSIHYHGDKPTPKTPEADVNDEEALTKKCKEIYGPDVSQEFIDRFIVEERIINRLMNGEISFEEASELLENGATKKYDEEEEDERIKLLKERNEERKAKNNVNNVERSGDANCDGDLTFADSVAVMQSIANPDKYGLDGSAENHLTETGKKSADIDNEPGLTLNDAIAIIDRLTQ